MGLHLGLGLPIQDPGPPECHDGTWRVSVESHGPPPQWSIDRHAMGLFNTTYCLLMPQLYKDDDALGPCCPVDHILAPDTWQLIQGPNGVLSHLGRHGWGCIIILALLNGASTCLIQLKAHEAIHCAPQSLGSTTDVLLGNQGANPLVIILRALLFFMSLRGLILALQRSF